MEKLINLYESKEHVLTPPDIGPVVLVGARQYNLKSLTQEELERLLNSPLTVNFLNRAKREEAAKPAVPKAPAPETDVDGSDSDGADEEKSVKRKK